MSDIRAAPPERTLHLVLLATAPTIWMAHFLLCYTTAAIWCARVAGPGGPLAGVRTAIVWYTIAALAGIAFVGWSGYARHRLGDETLPHDRDTPEDRHRFLGFATFLLAALSAVATLCVAAAALQFSTCD